MALDQRVGALGDDSSGYSLTAARARHCCPTGMEFVSVPCCCRWANDDPSQYAAPPAERVVKN